jgi:hypothetical protein
MSRWHILLPLIKSLLLKVSLAVGGVAVAWGGLYGFMVWLEPPWQQAQAQQQAAQAQLDQARADQQDLDTHRRTYEALKAGGLLGGEPRAIWVEDLLRTANAMGLQADVSFTLATPVAVDLPQAQAIGARVSRHVLEYTLTHVHDIEALQLTALFMRDHADVARLTGCALETPTPQGLSARCRVNFLHIDPANTPRQNGGS